MRPLKTNFNLSTSDTVKIIHLGSKSPVTVWLSDAMFVYGSDCTVMVNGRVQEDGYLPIKVKINGKVAYPRKKMCCLVPRMSVTLVFGGVKQENVSEEFLCSERDVDRVRYARYRKSLEFAINDERRAFYVSKMTEIQSKWKGRP